VLWAAITAHILTAVKPQISCSIFVADIRTRMFKQSYEDPVEYPIFKDFKSKINKINMKEQFTKKV
jgi:hypothetical protein